MHKDGMTKLEKLDWVLWLLNEIDQSTDILQEDMQTAKNFIADIRDCYIQDYK